MAVKDQQQQAKEILVIEVLDRQASNFVLDGSEESGLPVVLDTASMRRILPHCTIYDKSGKARKIRHILGCDTIFEDEQKEKGFVFNPQRDNIWFEMGRGIIYNNGPSASTYAYLKASPFNADAPYRNSEVIPIFREIKKEVVTANALELGQQTAEAMAMISRLYSKGEKGGTVYDENKINYLAHLFNVKGADDISDKLLALMTTAQTRPEFFLNTVANFNKEAIVNIRTAIEFNILSTVEKNAIFLNTNAKFFEFTQKDQVSRHEELAEYFLIPEGAMSYSNLLIELNAAKEKAAL